MDASLTLIEGYEQRIGRWSRRIAEQFAGWVGSESCQRVLDVGAGTGALSEAIANHAAPARLVALDPSVADLRYGREKRLNGDARSVAGSAFTLPFASKTFDAVLSGLVLNQFRDARAVVSEMVRVTKPGGTVAGYVWDFAGRMEPLRRFWDAAIALDERAREFDQGVKFPLCRLERLAQLFKDAGMRSVETQTVDVEAVYENFDSLWEPLVTGNGSVVDYALSLPPEHRCALRERMRRTVESGADGSIRLTVRALAVRGEVV